MESLRRLAAATLVGIGGAACAVACGLADPPAALPTPVPYSTPLMESAPLLPTAAPTETRRPPSTPTETPTPTITPTATATPTPTPTETATPSPTPTNDPFNEGAASAEVTFVIPPIVHYISETSATIGFELDAPIEGAILYRPVDGIPGGGAFYASALPPGRRYHQITLANLLPATTYEYVVRVGADGNYRQPLFAGAPWGNATLRTPPYGPPTRTVVIGDSGFGDPTTAALVNRMAALHPDLVIHTGDLVYSITEDASPLAAFTRKFFLPFAPLLRQAPFYPVVGNHEIYPETFWQGVPFYYHVFPPLPGGSSGNRQWYAVAVGDVQFVMLDTQTFFGERGDADQQSWLAGRLYDPSFSLTIPVFHVTPYSSGLHPNDGEPVQAAWVPLFEWADVPLVLCGHEHYYERLIINNLTYVTSGGGTATLFVPGEPLPGSQSVSRSSHFVLLEIYPDRIALQAIDVNGAVIDQATITRD